MIDFAGAFSSIAAAFPGVWISSQAVWPGVAVLDAGGSVTGSGAASTAPCVVQFDAVTDQMRSDTDFKDRDVRMLIIGASRAIDTEAMIVVASGERAGTWSIRSVDRDPAGIGWECRGRLCR